MNIFDEIAIYASEGYNITWDFGGGFSRKFQEWRITIKTKNKQILEDFIRMLSKYGKITEVNELINNYKITFITNDKLITAMKRRTNYWNDLTEYFKSNVNTSSQKYNVGFMINKNRGDFTMYPII